MKKIVLVLTLSIFFLNLRAQVVGIFGGGNINTNYHFREIHRVSTKCFPAKLGSFVGLGLDLIKIANLPIRITCSFDNLNGGIIDRLEGLGGRYNFSAIYNKQSLGLGIHLLNKKTKGNVRFSIGGEYNMLIHEKLNGSSFSQDGPISTSRTFNENDIKLSNNSYGLIGSIGFERNISKSLYIMPQLSFYFGLTKEFNNNWMNYWKSPWAFRVELDIGIFKRLKINRFEVIPSCIKWKHFPPQEDSGY